MIFSYLVKSDYMKKYLLRNVIWCLFVFIVCAVPGDSIPDTSFNIPYLDKLVHFGLFFVMGILLYAELRYQTDLSSFKVSMITVFIVACYGGFIELMQHYFFKGRSGDYWDFAADVIGGIAAVALYSALKKIRK